MTTTEARDRDRPRGGPCLLCRTNDEGPNYPNLIDHIHTTHADLAEILAQIMIDMAQMQRQIKGLSSR